MGGLLEYVHGNTIIHKLNPITKLILPFIMCIGCFSADNIFMLCGFLLYILLIAKIGGIFKLTFSVLIKLVKVMMFIFVLQILFIQRGEVLVPLVFGLNITKLGVLTAFQVVLRLICATLALMIMLTLTKLTSLSNELVAKCNLPYKYAFAVTSAIKFIPEFSNNMSEIMQAQTARGINFETKNILKKMKMIIPLCVPLLISSVKKIDQTAISAEMRGFNLRNKKCIYNVEKFHVRDLLSIIICIIITIVAIKF